MWCDAQKYEYLTENSTPRSNGSKYEYDISSRYSEPSSFTSTITGIGEEIMKHLYVILQTFCCGYCVDVEAFRSY